MIRETLHQGKLARYPAKMTDAIGQNLVEAAVSPIDPVHTELRLNESPWYFHPTLPEAVVAARKGQQTWQL